MFADTKPSISGHAPTILVVDDEAPIRMIVSEFLLDDGYHVIEAANVMEAKDVLAHTAVDVVFSDINMPGSETGFALEKWVRRHYPETRVLLASGMPQAAEHTRDLLEPMIAKPYRASAIVQRVERLLVDRKQPALAEG